MPTFRYTARDHDGNAIHGTMVSQTPEAIRELLRERELFVTSVAAQPERTVGDRRALFGLRRGVKNDDLMVFSRQLATLVRAGLPLNESLSAVAQQTENAVLTEVTEQMRRDILSGSGFAEAAAQHPRVFSDLTIALIRAGEAGGILDQTLQTAAEQYDREADLREKVRAAFTYPILVVVTALFVIGFLIAVVIPEFSKFYASFHATLPPLTLLLLALSRLALTPLFSLPLLSVGVLTWVGLRRWLHTPGGQLWWDQWKLKLPLFGPLNRKIAIARLCRALAAMVHAGVPILQALAISARVGNNRVLEAAMNQVGEYVQQGARLWMPMEQTGEFPPMVTRMIAAGEDSGNLDEMLSELSRFYTRDIDYSVQRLTRLLEPLLTFVVGGLVLFVLLALYLPIFNLGNVMRHAR